MTSQQTIFVAIAKIASASFYLYRNDLVRNYNEVINHTGLFPVAITDYTRNLRSLKI